MKKLFILMFLIFSLGGCAVVDGVECLTQIPRQIPRIQTYPEDGAENVPPNSVVVVEHGSRASNMGINAVDVNDPGWKYGWGGVYGSGKGIEGRQYLYVSGGSHEADKDVVDNLTSVPFEEVGELRTSERFSENGEVIVTVKVGCYESYEFQFTTGSLDDE